MEDAVVAKKYTRSSTQLTQLIQDCSVIFAIDATEIILRSRYGELRSDSDLQKLLETTDVVIHRYLIHRMHTIDSSLMPLRLSCMCVAW